MAGRSRGRGIANVTAAPVASAIYPSPAIPCFYTEYDGVDDHYYSSDAALKIAGNQTWCAEFYVDVGCQTCGIMSNGPVGATTSGIQLFYYGAVNNSLYFNAMMGGSWKTVAIEPITEGQWNTLVLVIDSGTSRAFINGVEVGTLASSGALTTSINNFSIGLDNYSSSRLLQGRIRNIEIYSGSATNGASWTPGNTSSLSGTSLVMQSRNGSGQDNEQSLTFTKVGDPQTLEC